MDAERWQRVEALFAAASELPPERRGVFLQAECAGEAAIEHEVWSLLRHADTDDVLLEVVGKTPWKGMLGALAGPATLAEQSRFGPYVIHQLLGSGGMGEVYLALDTRLKRRVALKLLASWIGRDPQMMSRFQQEALSASALNHPNIPVVYEAGEIDGRRFIAAEYVQGTPLNTLLRDGPLPWRRAVRIALQLAQALEAAHAAGIIHRDVKPGNILVADNGQVKLLDFGVAKFAEGRQATTSAGMPTLTQVGMVIGTPGYMAPEQALGLEVDQRSDVWGLAVVLFEMLAGHLPAPGTRRLPKSVRVPHYVKLAVSRGMQAEPQARLPSASAFAEILSPPWWRRGLAALSRRQQRIAAAAAAASLLLAGWLIHALGGVAGFGRGGPSIAVLPFINLTASNESAYLAGGVQEEVLSHLADISGLRVLAQHASAALPSQPGNLPEIGRELGVSDVLEGSVRVEDRRVHVGVRLIDTASGRERWSDSYDRELRDVFDVERDIAEQVALKLKARLLPDERRAVEQPDTLNPDAHAAALLGHYYLMRADETSLAKALDSLETATRLDPGYARAFAELSTVWDFLCYYRTGPELLRAKAQARSTAREAVRLGPTLPEAHAALGWIYLTDDWDFRAAEQEFEAAVAHGPNSARARNGLAGLYADQGQFERAAAQFRQARLLDPTSSGFALNEGMVADALGHRAEAEKLYRESIELDGKTTRAHSVLAFSLLARGAGREALREAALETDPSYRDFALALVRQTQSGRDEAQAALQQFMKQYAADSPFLVAQIYAARGDADAAFKWLERAYDQRDAGTIELLMTLPFFRLHQDPRFAAFCAKLGVRPSGA